MSARSRFPSPEMKVRVPRAARAAFGRVRSVAIACRNPHGLSRPVNDDVGFCQKEDAKVRLRLQVMLFERLMSLLVGYFSFCEGHLQVA